MDWFLRNKYILIILLLLVPLSVFGQIVTIDNPLSSSDILVIIGRIINWIFTISLFLAVIMYIISGIRFLTAAGDPEKINTAKKMALWVTIGLMIVIAAKGIVVLIGTILGVSITIP
ncbi:hypothetical protein AMJ47_01830 [Parcubacteria bacterium DG_72]|nr:MAG: hypothetical protein AMJ47_01830 [Parcubacteria bacterium DG_72]